MSGGSVDRSRELAAGQNLGPYVVLDELGRGGMGIVYLGTDTRLDRQVAIKLMSLDSAAAVSRFMAEARVTARCKHPNIVIIHDVGAVEGVPYLVLEYVEGESALALLRRGAWTPAEVVAAMTDVARGLAYAHSRGILHRDLKPANILLTSDGTAKIVDFGIARAFGDSAQRAAVGGDAGMREHTSGSAAIGTLQYLAPEVIRGEAMDARADIWSFGATLYELLSARSPLEGFSSLDLLDHLADLDREVPRLDAIAPGLPPSVVELTHRCLEKHPQLRVASANELVAALEALPSLDVAAPDPVSQPEPVIAGARRDRGVRVWGFGAGLALLLVMASLAVWFVVRTPGDRRAAVAPAPDPQVDVRVATLAAAVARLDAGGATEEAERLFDDFLRDERDPRAQALAGLARGDRAVQHGAQDAAVEHYASAYARAGDDDVRRRALLALSLIYLERWEWDHLATALAVYDTIPGRGEPRDQALQERLQLAIRDQVPGSRASPAAVAIAGSLLAGRPTDLAIASAKTVDFDGDGEDELVTIEGDGLVVRRPGTLGEVARRPAGDDIHIHCAGRDRHGAYVVASGPLGDAPRIVPLVDGTPVPLATFGFARMPGICRSIDLDGRDGDELYFVIYQQLIRFARDAGGTWHQRAWPLGSQLSDLVGGDLDGDGRGELIIAAGEWQAYDVRLVRIGAGDQLQIHDRIRLGLVERLADLGRDAGGVARIAALKVDGYPSVRSLPAEHPFGAPAGLYVLELHGDRLAVRSHVDVAGVPKGYPSMSVIEAADIDGDGQRDMAASVSMGDDENVLVMLGQPDGTFITRVVSGETILAALPGTSGAGDDLIARVDGRIWILGAEGEPVRPRTIATVAAGEPAGDAAREPAIDSAWRRAEQLATIGQVRAAADALQRLATLATSPAVKAAALRRATGLLAAGDRPAAEPFEALAQLATLSDRERSDAWLAAVEDDLAHVAMIDAAQRVARLRASGITLTDAQRTRLNALTDQLAGESRTIFAGDTLTDAWRVQDPAVVHVVPRSGELTLETLTPGPVASVSLAGGERRLTVAIDAELTRTEWAANLRFALRPQDGDAAQEIFLDVGAYGGGHVYERRYACGSLLWQQQTAEPLPDADARVRMRIEISVVPERGRGRCWIDTGRRQLSVDLRFPPHAHDRWVLSLGASEVAKMSSAVAKIKTITIAGAVAVEAPPPALDAVALALANHRADAARTQLAALGRATAATWRARRLAAMAADEAGDRGAAVAALRGVTAELRTNGALLEELAVLARARDGQFAPTLRDAFGRHAALLLLAAWSTTAHHDLDEPRVQATLIRDLDGLPPPSAETRDATLSLLGYRGEALFAAGRPDDARRVLVEAAALARPEAPPEIRDRAARIAYVLAVDGAARNDEPAARRWALRSLELGTQPELAADMLLLDPSIRELATRPGWEPVHALGRTVHVGEAPR